MHKIIANEIYTHRGSWIIRDDETGLIAVENHKYWFKTFADARRYIDKFCDSTNDKEPVIIGERW